MWQRSAMARGNVRLVRAGIAAVACAVVTAPDAARAQPPELAARVIPAADLQSDLALLRRAFESLHPGLHRYRSPAEIDAAFAALERKFGQDRTLAEAYLGLAGLTAYLQCGHTYPNFYNQGPAVTAALLEAPRLPFEFRWLDGRMVVTRSFATTPALRPGAEVLSIDGRPAGEILAALLPYSRADGANDARRISNLEVQGRGRYEAFDVYFPSRFPRPPSQPFELVVRRSPGAATEVVSVPGMAAAARPATEGAPRGAVNPWQYLEPEPGVGLLRMPTWALYNSSWDWQGYLDALFRDLADRGIGDLVLDLRANEGGSDVGSAIVAHLVAEDLPAGRIERRTRYRSVPADLRPHLETWDRSFYDWGTAATDLGDGYFRLVREGETAEGLVIRPRAPRYTGRLWVLVGPVNSSATFEFASAVRRHGLGTLVGQPTGGNQRGITGGAFFFLRLPHTGIEIDVPLIGQFPMSSTQVPDAGVEPDLPVRPTIEDVSTGRDMELEAVLARIREQRDQAPASRGTGGRRL